MGKIRVLYFAALRDLAARDEELLELPAAVATVAEALEHLERVRPALAGRLGCVRAALNEAFVERTDIVSNGDTLALIPPVSGG
jgi:molybdopterin converting factor subunit 1